MKIIKIGRDPGCNIVMHSDKVSSLHAEITMLDSGDIQLEDKNSRNGTFIMNQRIAPGKPVSIRRGDAIRFADCELQWSQIPLPEDNSAYTAIYGIGSHFNNDFQISGSTVSRYHATVKIGRDGKVYLVDHSKNGTTVDGSKIPSNQPVQIRKRNSVVCGGVPVDLKRLNWPINWLKSVSMIAACIVLITGLGWGIYKIVPCSHSKMTPTEIHNRYSSSIVMMYGFYHYEVDYGSIPDLLQALGWDPVTKFFIDKDGDISKCPNSVDINEIMQYRSTYSATGFFISTNGQILTNLHVVKPWLFNEDIKKIEAYCKQDVAELAEKLTQLGIATGLTANISEIKVKGVLDFLGFVPQGKMFHSSNLVECEVISAGEDIHKDVALVISTKSELPRGASYVNVVDSMQADENLLTVGLPVILSGFPKTLSLQAETMNTEQGIQVVTNPGTISQQPSEFEFMHNAISAGGASGSPVFNEYGMLIGIHHAGFKDKDFNYAIKAKYIKELLEAPHTK